MLEQLFEQIKEEKEKDIYIPYYFDLMFYKIFGDDNDLESIIYLFELLLDIKVDSLRILNDKVVGDKIKTKKSFLDLLLLINEKIKVNIEVNTDTSQIIKERNINFILKVVSNDYKLGEDYRLLNKHYQFNFNVEKNTNYSIEHYVFKEINSDKILTEKIEIVNINLSYYTEKCYNEGASKLNQFEKLMALLGAKDNRIEEMLNKEKGTLKKIMDKGKNYRKDSEIIEMYDREQIMKQVHDEEIIKTTEEVTNKVTIDTTKKIAINMIEKGIKDDDISDVTGLSIEELKELKKELN